MKTSTFRNMKTIAAMALALAACFSQTSFASDTLSIGKVLNTNHRITSSNGAYVAQMQADCNFVVYKKVYTNWKPLWASNTAGRGAGCFLAFQGGDGNLVIYDQNHRGIWATHKALEANPGNRRLIMQNDGNLVIYKNNAPIWATNTIQRHTDIPGALKRASDAISLWVQEITRSGSVPQGMLSGLRLGRNATATTFREVTEDKLTFFVASDENQVIIAFRGTESQANKAMNNDGVPSIVGNFDQRVMHVGWAQAVNAIYPTITAELARHNASRKSLLITGHSMGGVISGYLTYRLLKDNLIPTGKESYLITFGAPRYGGRVTSAGQILPTVGSLFVGKPTTWRSFKDGIEERATASKLNIISVEFVGDTQVKLWETGVRSAAAGFGEVTGFRADRVGAPFNLRFGELRRSDGTMIVDNDQHGSEAYGAAIYRDLGN